MQETQEMGSVPESSGEDPLEKETQPTLQYLAWET